MQTENKIAHEQAPANADAQQAPAQEAKYVEAKRVVSMALDADGAAHGSREQAKNLSQLLKTRPDLRSEILAILHETPGLGNSFVYMVMHPGDNKGYAMAVNRESDDEGTKENKNTAASIPAPPAPAKDDGQSAAQSELGPAPPGGWRAPNLSASERSKLNDGLEGSAPTSKGPTPGPQSAEAKQEEPAPSHPKEPAPPTNEVAPPGKQDVAAAEQGPVPAPPAQEAAPKADAKAEEKGKDEKPEEKADGAMVKITASALRVRAASNVKSAVLGKIPRGGTAKVKGHDGVWLKIDWHGQDAFIHSKYTTSVKGNESGEEEEQDGEQSSHEQKQERPKAPPMVNDDQQQGVLV